MISSAQVLRQPGTVVGAVDIGGTKIAIGAIDAQGNILARDEILTLASRGFNAVMADVASGLRTVQSKAGRDLSGIGIGCTGPVDPFTGEIGAVEFLPGWEGCNPVVQLSERLQIGAALENDADAAALGEAQWGVGRGRKNLISLTVGTGIGGGIMLNGALYRGVDGAHPEIGHHVIDTSGPACFCGASGCWEALASGPSMVRRFLGDGPETAIASRTSARSICAEARAGEAAAVRAVELQGVYLGLGIANLITLFVPEVIAYSGSVMESADQFLPAIRRVIDHSCGLVPARKVELVRSSLGRDAPLIGAAAVWNLRETASSC